MALIMSYGSNGCQTNKLLNYVKSTRALKTMQIVFFEIVIGYLLCVFIWMKLGFIRMVT